MSSNASVATAQRARSLLHEYGRRLGSLTSSSHHWLRVRPTPALAPPAQPRPASFWHTAQNTFRESAAASSEDLDPARVHEAAHVRERAKAHLGRTGSDPSGAIT
jgi:hypothetical protein